MKAHTLGGRGGACRGTEESGGLSGGSQKLLPSHQFCLPLRGYETLALLCCSRRVRWECRSTAERPSRVPEGDLSRGKAPFGRHSLDSKVLLVDSSLTCNKDLCAPLDGIFPLLSLFHKNQLDQDGGLAPPRTPPDAFSAHLQQGLTLVSFSLAY